MLIFFYDCISYMYIFAFKGALPVRMFVKLIVIHPCQSTGFLLYPLKVSKTRGFLILSGGMEREQCYEMG